MSKTAEAFRTISEVASELDVPKHVLRFWEARFPQIRPMKRGGGRRYYRPEDLALLRGICHLLHAEGYTIKGVQKILREQGVDSVKRVSEQTAPPKVAPEAAGKRGRRGKAQAEGAVAGSDAAGTLKAAIAELELCRDILMGKAVDTGARRRAKPRRAIAP
ncbi:MAG TPA: MerR family transcriptional regulator [Hyphomicrobium sp.]|jgi:DNA-binding transcriptional MerR regulator|nr:MerR family transcriptional regulator [Hyphomicrobium sp.]